MCLMRFLVHIFGNTVGTWMCVMQMMIARNFWEIELWFVGGGRCVRGNCVQSWTGWWTAVATRASWTAVRTHKCVVDLRTRNSWIVSFCRQQSWSANHIRGWIWWNQTFSTASSRSTNNLPEFIHKLFRQSTRWWDTLLTIFVTPVLAFGALEAKKHLLIAQITSAARKFEFFGESVLDHVAHHANRCARRSWWPWWSITHNNSGGHVMHSAILVVIMIVASICGTRRRYWHLLVVWNVWRILSVCGQLWLLWLWGLNWKCTVHRILSTIH